MRRIPFLLVLALSWALIGCGGRAALSPTPFPTAGPTMTLPVTGPIALSVTELMTAPGLYRDAEVQLTGLLRKQPIVVCNSGFHPSPAGWGLAEEGVLALAGGFEQQIRSLLPDNLMMTVEGRWRRWEGIVGCGKQAQQQEVWYLEVGRILSPSPITQVTLTPASGIEIAAMTPTLASVLEPTVEEGASETPIVDETPQFPETTEESGAFPSPTLDLFGGTLTSEAGTPALFPTVPIAGTPGATLPSNLTPTPTTIFGQTPGGTPTITPTFDPALPTPTPTGTSGAPGQVVTKGNLYDEMNADFIVSNLAGGTTDSWELDISEGDSLFVYVVAPSPADIILSVLSNGQPIVNRQNTAPVGSPEIINNPNLQGTDLVEIQVSTNGGVSTDYALIFYTDPESPIVTPGILVSGTPRSAVQMPAGTYHYWFFVANAGDDLSALLTPLGEEDPAFYLFDPEGEEIASADDGFEGDEELIEMTLSVSGIYALSIEEVYGDPLGYNIQITLQ